jgi:uncharacterized membrane protein YuzA (DUF378 family)
MLVFKRGIGGLVWSLIIAIVTGVMIALIGSAFTSSIIPYVVAGVASLILIYMAFTSENIRFEIEGAQFRYYQQGKLVNVYDIGECDFRYSAKGTNGSYDSIDLYVTPPQGGEAHIDCSSLSYAEFSEMFAVLNRDKKAAVMEAEKKQK